MALVLKKRSNIATRNNLLKKPVLKAQPKEIEAEAPEVAEVLSLEDTTMGKLFNAALGISEKCEDFFVTGDSDHIQLCESGRHITYTPVEGDKRTSEISRYALSQLGSKIGVPANYLIKCVEKGKPELAQHNINSWLEDREGEMFFREYDGRIRGVLSDHYAVCDTPEVIQVLSDNLDLNDFKIKGFFLSEERFHLRMAQKTKMNVAGEDLFAGLTIDSSDVGRSTLTVQFLVFKQVCTNGLIVSRGRTQLFKQKHIGITAEAFAEGLSHSIELFPDITALVEKSINKTRDMPLLYDFNYQSEEDLADLVDHIRKDTTLLAPQANRVIDIMRSEKYELNRWGYINALTEVAQELTLEKRLGIEQYAGRLLAA